MMEAPKWPIEKGRKMLVEIEFIKDLDMYEHQSILLESLYGEKREEGINGEFKVNTIYHHQGFDDIKESIKKDLIEAIDRLR